MSKFILISLFSFAFLDGAGQHCQIKDSLTYQDSLNVFLDFTYHLYSNKRIDFQEKLTTVNLADRIDTVFFFLIPDSEMETQGDGDFISFHCHKSTILKQQNPKWFEITKLRREKDHYTVILTLNQLIDNEVAWIYTFRYKAHCVNPKKPLIFKKERIKKSKADSD